MTRSLSDKIDISLTKLSRHIGQTPHNFNKKLKQDTFFEEVVTIVGVLNIEYE